MARGALREGDTVIDIRPGYDVYRVRPQRVSWKAPVFMNNDWMALRLLDFMRDMGVERPFDVVYGAPLCAWAGGRPCAVRRVLGRAEFESYVRAYADRGVKVALTLSRLEVTDGDLEDPYCSMLLDVVQAYGGQAIVVQDKLARRIRRTYPGIALIASLDKAMTELRHGYGAELGYYRRLLETYDEVVARCEVALDDRLLEGVADVAGRVELIVNQVCVPNCQHCYEHISSMEALNVPGAPNAQPQRCHYVDKAMDPAWSLSHSLFVSESRICELAGRGFGKLKLAGRNAPIPKLMDMLGTYVFEPSGAFYQIRNHLMREYRLLGERRGCPVAPYELPA